MDDRDRIKLIAAARKLVSMLAPGAYDAKDTKLLEDDPSPLDLIEVGALLGLRYYLECLPLKVDSPSADIEGEALLMWCKYVQWEWGGEPQPYLLYGGYLRPPALTHDGCLIDVDEESIMEMGEWGGYTIELHAGSYSSRLEVTGQAQSSEGDTERRNREKALARWAGYHGLHVDLAEDRVITKLQDQIADLQVQLESRRAALLDEDKQLSADMAEGREKRDDG